MNVFRAVNLVEGFEEPDEEGEVLEAWQHLVDTGVAWQLQGSIGRQAVAMIEQGIINPPQVQ